jgi:hypothetical protein
MERLEKLEDDVFRYGNVVESSMDAHHLMNLELEKKVKFYDNRIKRKRRQVPLLQQYIRHDAVQFVGSRELEL